MRGMFTLVSLLFIGLGAAYYFTEMQPGLAPSGHGTQYSKIESQANAAAAQMAQDPQAEVDAAGAPATAPATNAAPASPQN